MSDSRIINVSKDGSVRFIGADDQPHILKSVTRCRKKAHMTLRNMRDLIKNPETGAMDMLFAIIDVLKPDTRDALLDLDINDAEQIIAAWWNAADEKGAAVPQS
jgi:hypothetical protein